MRFHCLDLGVARFMDGGFFYAIPGKFNLAHLQSGASKLLEIWPELNSRLNIVGGRLSENRDNGRVLAWQSKTMPHSLSEVFPSVTNNLKGVTPGIDLDTLLSFPASATDLLNPPILSITAILLRDACLLAFSMQHPLCDATGLHHIADGYFSILSGRPVDPLSSRGEIALKDEKTPLGTDHEQSSSPGLPSEFTQLQIRANAVGWGSLIQGSLKAAFSKSQQLSSSFRISSSMLEELRKQARMDGLDITLNDLIMAIVMTASTASPSWKRLAHDSTQYPTVAFVLNIRRQIEHDVEVHNPFVFIEIPHPSLATGHTSGSPTQTLIALAAHVRKTIRNARSMDCLHPLIELHRNANGKPMVSQSMFLVTSWGDLPVWQKSFPIEKKTVEPEYVHPFLRTPALFRKFGVGRDNYLIISLDKQGGFWLHGKLEGAVWDELAKIAPGK
ncbi:hypothetical protein BJX76DRAFT_358840 [Aspergillus varians]